MLLNIIGSGDLIERAWPYEKWLISTHHIKTINPLKCIMKMVVVWPHIEKQRLCFLSLQKKTFLKSIYMQMLVNNTFRIFSLDIRMLTPYV